MRSGIPLFSTDRNFMPSVSASWLSGFSPSRALCRSSNRSWWLLTAVSMDISSWDALASSTMFRLPTVISSGFSVVAFFPASFRTTSRTFLDFSARVRISSKRRRYSPKTLLVSDSSLSRVSAIAWA